MPVPAIGRREFLRTATAIGATLAWPVGVPLPSPGAPVERRDLFPQGVGSGDPDPESVLLWTRRPPVTVPRGRAARLRAELAADPEFRRVIVAAEVRLTEANDWTCRVLAAGLEPRRVYWYRFTDEHGFASRVGRTVTAPAPDDGRPVRFTFVSCQNVQQGSCDAYRRMRVEDDRLPPDEQFGFVLHLGDYVYELVWYPEDRPQGMYDRRLRDILRYPHGERIDDFHVPTTVDDYRALYRAYLADPDLQDARARWPFVPVWDNHEFSWTSWQSTQDFGPKHGGARPAQTRKVAANQAWFEYQPARVHQPGAPPGDRFEAPVVHDHPVGPEDEHGLATGRDNLAAIESLAVHRAVRWGRNVELLVTDDRSFRAPPAMSRPEAAVFQADGVPWFEPAEVIAALDAGRSYAGGNPPATLRFAGGDHPNPRRESPPSSMLGRRQKGWFKDRLRASTATWKLWGNSDAALDWRADLHNLPGDLRAHWAGTGYGQLGDDDWSGYRAERAELLEFVRRSGITGLVSIAGDRHTFCAGTLSPTLPPDPFEPVAVEFITGSVSAPGLAEAAEHRIPRDHPLRALYLYDGPDGRPVCALSATLRHGVRATLALERSGDPTRLSADRNPEVAPHLGFLDVGGHGFSMVRATADALEVEFVCIPRPVERSAASDGGPIRYRISHRVARWEAGATPRVDRVSARGDLPLGT
jgi:alkaline phosphatase D